MSTPTAVPNINRYNFVCSKYTRPNGKEGKEMKKKKSTVNMVRVAAFFAVYVAQTRSICLRHDLDVFPADSGMR